MDLKKVIMREIMNSPVVTVKHDDQVDAAFDLMQEHKFKHLPVIDADGRIVGVLSDRDIRNIAFACEARPKGTSDYIFAQTEVHEIMTKNIVTAASDASMQEALEKMTARSIGCLPIVEDERVVGILSATDFLRIMLSMVKS